MVEGNVELLTEGHAYYIQASMNDGLFQNLAKEISLEFLELQAQ